jgi:L-lactate dehydrogenase (cytochrome)
LGAMGQAGVHTTLELMRKELDVTMALTGTRDVKEIGPHKLWSNASAQ